MRAGIGWNTAASSQSTGDATTETAHIVIGAHILRIGHIEINLFGASGGDDQAQIGNRDTIDRAGDNGTGGAAVRAAGT